MPALNLGRALCYNFHRKAPQNPYAMWKYFPLKEYSHTGTGQQTTTNDKEEFSWKEQEQYKRSEQEGLKCLQ